MRRGCVDSTLRYMFAPRMMPQDHRAKGLERQMGLVHIRIASPHTVAALFSTLPSNPEQRLPPRQESHRLPSVSTLPPFIFLHHNSTLSFAILPKSLSPTAYPTAGNIDGIHCPCVKSPTRSANVRRQGTTRLVQTHRRWTHRLISSRQRRAASQVHSRVTLFGQRMRSRNLLLPVRTNIQYDRSKQRLRARVPASRG